jgi:hypothetical protein
MLPGGLGVAEGSLTALLAGLGTPLPAAAAATLLVRGATLWLAVALGVLTVLVAFPRAAAAPPAARVAPGTPPACRAAARPRAAPRAGGMLSSPLWRRRRQSGSAWTSCGG